MQQVRPKLAISYPETFWGYNRAFSPPCELTLLAGEKSGLIMSITSSDGGESQVHAVSLAADPFMTCDTAYYTRPPYKSEGRMDAALKPSKTDLQNRLARAGEALTRTCKRIIWQALSICVASSVPLVPEMTLAPSPNSSFA
jgi:hypothetical protein